MNTEATLATPVQIEMKEALLLTPAKELPAVEQPNVEQAAAVEAVFTEEQQQESQLVAGLLGMWAGTALLHDLAVETFRAPADESKPRPRLKPKKDENE